MKLCEKLNSTSPQANLTSLEENGDSEWKKTEFFFCFVENGI